MKVRRIVSIGFLFVSAGALFLALKKPVPVAVAPQTPAQIAEHAQAFQSKIEELDRPKMSGSEPVEVRLSADEVNAAIAAARMAPTAASATGGASSVPDPAQLQDTKIPSAATELGPGQANVKDYKVNFAGDEVQGQFLADVGGKDVWVTLKGHLGAKDGYATFDPTEFKVGDLSIPVTLMNDALQKKLMEQRDQLKLPENVGGLKVENGEVVLTQR